MHDIKLQFLQSINPDTFWSRDWWFIIVICGFCGLGYTQQHSLSNFPLVNDSKHLATNAIVILTTSSLWQFC